MTPTASRIKIDQATFMRTKVDQTPIMQQTPDRRGLKVDELVLGLITYKKKTVRFVSNCRSFILNEAREAFVICKGRTIDPHGLNIREETY